jgi:catechol 2,3-dioxygenase-like lactoylglutathione lyase family enzyme/predicted enzyme related to lactoylglutathione lyase
MPLARWKDLCFDATDMAVAADFWAPVLGLAAERHPRRSTVTRLGSERPEETTWVNEVPEPKTVKNRVHLDLVRPDVDTLVAAGAAVLHEPSPGWEWHVLADPEGNEFCVFAPAPDEPTALVADAVDEEASAAWWADVLGATLSPGPEGHPRWLRDVPGLPYDVWKFVGVPDVKTVKNRWHWDVVCDDLDALVRKGATLLRGPDDDISWHVLADPEGNEFCAMASD